jgi:hypothetical protein
MKTPNTTSGAMNREKVIATPQMGTRGTKDNGCEATLRSGNLPEAEKVTDAVEVKGAHAEAVAVQTNNPPDDSRRTRGNSNNGMGCE